MDKGTRLQIDPGDVFRALVVGIFPWIISISFGAILLDIIYARSVPEATAAFSEAADFLLLIGVVTIPAAIMTIGLSWKSRIARISFGASLIIITLGFFMPVAISQLFPSLVGSWVTTALRVAISGLTSILAFVGLYGFYRQA